MEEFCRFVRFDVSNGSNISLWHDVWCGDQSLKVALPVFSISRFKEGLVANHLQLSKATL